MIKNLIAFILLSLGVVFGAHHIHPILLLLVSARDWLSQLMLQLYSGGNQLGFALRNVLSLLIVPFVIGAIPLFVYWLSKRRYFPYFLHVVWVVWLTQVTAIVVLQRFII
ncbi:MAG TPA: hypothetical protein VLH77_06210 [Gammaproteobacteria bacterium]|nr:hypothetical protein [Gammaproteobacteria bacterium]